MSHPDIRSWLQSVVQEVGCLIVAPDECNHCSRQHIYSFDVFLLLSEKARNSGHTKEHQAAVIMNHRVRRKLFEHGISDDALSQPSRLIPPARHTENWRARFWINQNFMIDLARRVAEEKLREELEALEIQMPDGFKNKDDAVYSIRIIIPFSRRMAGSKPLRTRAHFKEMARPALETFNRLGFNQTVVAHEPEFFPDKKMNRLTVVCALHKGRTDSLLLK